MIRYSRILFGINLIFEFFKNAFFFHINLKHAKFYSPNTSNKILVGLTKKKKSKTNKIQPTKLYECNLGNLSKEVSILIWFKTLF